MLTVEFNSYHIARMPFPTEFLRFIVISFNYVCMRGVCALECRCPRRSEALDFAPATAGVAGACDPPKVQTLAICKSSTCS